MQIKAIKIRRLLPPQDDLKGAILKAKFSLKEGDIIVLSSKVVSIGEGRTLPIGTILKEDLIKQESDWHVLPSKSKYRRIFTIAGGALVGSAGIDESNGNGHYILYPKAPIQSAKHLRKWFLKTYGIKRLGLIVADSTSIPLRRGAVGFALAYAGFNPLKDYRGERDLFGRPFQFEVANLADSFAAAATLVMGEGDEGTPLAIIQGASSDIFKKVSKNSLAVDPADDLFAPLFFGAQWKRNRK